MLDTRMNLSVRLGVVGAGAGVGVLLLRNCASHEGDAHDREEDAPRNKEREGCHEVGIVLGRLGWG